MSLLGEVGLVHLAELFLLLLALLVRRAVHQVYLFQQGMWS
jgi:hypothetical protein